jgi:tRNA 5-methylaminomethyl-2-thiouridine biosynthesis bifunctional protein
VTVTDTRDPGLVIRDGVPVSTRFDDVYFSRAGGLEEVDYVFLAGAGLPHAWAGRSSFTIAETGFGTGLNFLATWDLWRRTGPSGGVLHYLAVEGFPIRRGTLATVLAPFRSIAVLASRLIARYPRPDAGLHRLWFPEDRVCLTLAIGEAASILPKLDARVDAWFLDGFAPAKNPTMWELVVLDEVARLAAPGCQLATFTAAGAVRRGLETRGFTMQRRPGFGSKRECLAGTHVGASADRVRPPDRVAVIGAGIAGAALVGSLRRRGAEVSWVDQRTTIAAEASGNPLGIMMPRPTLDGDPGGALSVAAFRYALAECAERGVAIGGDGVLELAGDPAMRARHQRLTEAGVLDPMDGRLVDAAEASRIAGVALDRSAVWYRRAGWVSPPALVRALAGDGETRFGQAIDRVDRFGEVWRLVDVGGCVVDEVDAVVFATGATATAFQQLAGIPMGTVRGQLSLLRETDLSRRLRSALTFGGYLAPSVGGIHVAGATYEWGGFDPSEWPQPVKAEEHDRIRTGLPDQVSRWFDGIRPIGGRAALRAATPDRLPVAGPVPEGEPAFPVAGLHVLSGLGSRGLVTAPLLAELVVSRLLGEPCPIERETAAALAPDRFLERARRRRVKEAPGRRAGHYR